jgi:hypothetical protein
MSYETAHWRAFNRFVRAFGLVALFVGVCLVWSSITRCWNGTCQPARADAPRPAEAVAMFVVGLGAIAMGVALVRVRPYRPDLGDDAFGRPTQYQASPERQWWTGDPRSDPSDRAP